MILSGQKGTLRISNKPEIRPKTPVRVAELGDFNQNLKLKIERIQIMKGTIKNIIQDGDEILVQPDHGGLICVAVDDPKLAPNGIHLGFSSESNPKMREILIQGDSDYSICFIGDRITYKKTGPGEYVVCQLLVKADDPRIGSKDVKVE